MDPKYQRTGSRPFRARGRGYNPSYNRDDDGMARKNLQQQESTASDNTTMAMFRAYSDQLDAKNDLYEMLVKNSRDTTIESKRIIFLLIRCAGHSKESLEMHQILSDARTRLLQLENSSLQYIAKCLSGEDSHLFNRAFTAGLQEYIESLSLFHYLSEGSLIELEQVQKRLIFSEEEHQFSVLVTPTDYLLGIGDLTGELMRYTITHASSIGADTAIFRLCDFARSVLIEYQRVPYGVGKDFGIKLKVMFQSIAKIERICYQLALRKAENLPVLPSFMIKLDDDAESREVY